MNTSLLKPALLLAVGLLLAPFASAQVTLHDFTAFQSPDTFFVGDWELTGDVGGTNSPRASFSQGAGFYNFAGGNNDVSSGAFYFYPAPLNISGYSLLQISAERLQGNTAASFDVTLFDLGGNSALATFLTAALSPSNFTTLYATLNLTGFDSTQLAGFQISGNAFGGTSTLSVAVNNLAVVSAVPEPSTYGLFAAIALVGVAGFRRVRRFRE